MTDAVLLCVTGCECDGTESCQDLCTGREKSMSGIEQAAYEALGAVSVCWTDEGVFDSEQVKAIAEDLMYRIVQEVEQARADERERIADLLQMKFSMTGSEEASPMTHDPLCGECSPHDHYCHCALIDLARADEREQIVAEAAEFIKRTYPEGPNSDNPVQRACGVGIRSEMATNKTPAGQSSGSTEEKDE